MGVFYGCVVKFGAFFFRIMFLSVYSEILLKYYLEKVCEKKINWEIKKGSLKEKKEIENVDRGIFLCN